MMQAPVAKRNQRKRTDSPTEQRVEMGVQLWVTHWGGGEGEKRKKGADLGKGQLCRMVNKKLIEGGIGTTTNSARVRETDLTNWNELEAYPKIYKSTWDTPSKGGTVISGKRN